MPSFIRVTCFIAVSNLHAFRCSFPMTHKALLRGLPQKPKDDPIPSLPPVLTPFTKGGVQRLLRAAS